VGKWSLAVAVVLVGAIVVTTTSFTSSASKTTSAVSYWRPGESDRFQIILSNPPTPAQSTGDYTMIELDGFDATAAAVATFHAHHKRVVCYIDTGTWENWRPDAKSFPKSVLGKPDDGWPGERWLDIRQQAALLPIMSARLRMCELKGFDAVDPDNVDGVENPTGFPLTWHEQLSYDRAIASLAHHDHLAVALKSFADAARELAPSFDFAVQEQCAQYQQCGEFGAFVHAGKPVFDIEYTNSLAFCSTLPHGVYGIAKRLALTPWIRRCPQ
jgi:hypothetical protein